MNSKDLMTFEEYCELSQEEAYKRWCAAANRLDEHVEQIVSMSNEYQELKHSVEKLNERVREIGMCDRCGMPKTSRYVLTGDVAADLCNSCRTALSRWIVSVDVFIEFRLCTTRHNCAISLGDEITAEEWLTRQAAMQNELIDKIEEWIRTPPVKQ